MPALHRFVTFARHGDRESGECTPELEDGRLRELADNATAVLQIACENCEEDGLSIDHVSLSR